MPRTRAVLAAARASGLELDERSVAITVGPVNDARLRRLVVTGMVGSFVFVRHSMTTKRDPSLPRLEGDLARRLTDEGVAKCEAAGRQWFRRLRPKLCLVSPTLRTTSTCNHLLGDAAEANIEIVDSIYNPAASDGSTVMGQAITVG